MGTDTQQLISFFARHVVCLAAFDKTPAKGGKEFQAASGFLIKVRGRIYMVTAAHVLENLTKLIGQGHDIRDLQIFDGIGLDSPFRHGIPFNFLEMSQVRFSGSKADIAVIALPPPYAQNLAANSKEALDERGWRTNLPTKCDGYFMLGIPTQRTIHEGNAVTFSPTLINVRREDASNLQDCEDLASGAFHGRISVRQDQVVAGKLSDIDGMSGGPIFGVQRTESGETKYWAIAIQSSWYKKQGVIEAFYLKVALDELDEFLRKFDEEEAPKEDI